MNILLTSAGRRSYLVEYFRNAWKGFGEVHAANSTLDATALFFADRYVITPSIYDDTYINFLINYCSDFNIRAILPLFDIDLPILSAQKERFQKAGINVIVAGPQALQICNDKWKTFQVISELRLQSPQTFLSIESALANPGLFPMIIKPRWGMGSIGIYRADNEQELVVLYKKLDREIDKTYLKYESYQTPGQKIIIQQYIDGEEYGLDVVNDLDGNFVTTFVKKKLSMRSGETDGAVTVEDEYLFKIGKQLSTCLKHPGNLDVDVLKHNEKYYVLELNARFGGGYPFSHLAGANLPEQIKRWLKGESTDRNLLSISTGVTGFKSISIVGSPFHT